MLVLLLIGSQFLIFLFFYSKELLSGIGFFSSVRLGLIKTLIISALLCYAFAELLSIYNLLTTNYLALCWFVVLSVTGFLLFRKKMSVVRFNFAYKNISRTYWIYIGLMSLLIILPLFILAILIPPNNYDSMTYHLPRVMHWIQNQNIYPYPTNNIRQIGLTPLAEYIILNLQLLSGNDYFANLVQWFSMLGSLAVVSLFVKEFGIGYKGQFIAILLALSIPMSIFQSTTTQNDYVASFFFLCFIYFGYRSIYRQDRFWHTILFMSCSLFLGGLAKFTTLIFALPFCVWFGFLYFKKFSIRKVIFIASILLVVSSTILFPFFVRNQIYFQSPIGPGNTKNVMINDDLSIVNMLSNSSKNIVDNFVLPIDSYNLILLSGVEKFQKILGSLDQKSSNYFGPYWIQYRFHEDYAGSPLHILVFIFAGFILLFNKNPNKRIFLVFYLCIIFAFLAYSFLIKWAPTSANRYGLILLLASSIVSGIALVQVFSKKPFFAHLLIVILLVYSLFPVYFNPGKPFPSSVATARYLLKQPKRILDTTAITFAIPSKFREKILGFYDSTGIVYKIKQTLSYKEKVQLYELEDSLQFFRKERRSIFTISRLESYFTYRSDLYNKYKTIVDSIPSTCNKIELCIGSDTYEYPFWILVRQKFGDDFKMGATKKENQKLPLRNLYSDGFYDISIVEFDKESHLPDKQFFLSKP